MEKRVFENVIIMDGAVVVGDVEIGEGSSVWYNAVIRADCDAVRIGKRTNVQECAVIHESKGIPTVVGDEVTIGHGAIVHGCTIGDRSLIGMGSIILDGAKIGKNCLIGAGALVTQNAEIPDGSLAFGNPARVKRALTESEIAGLAESAEEYVKLAEEAVK